MTVPVNAPARATSTAMPNIPISAVPGSDKPGSVVLTWPPVKGVGLYRLFKDGKAVSISEDPTKTTWAVSKPFTKIEIRAYSPVIAKGFYP